MKTLSQFKEKFNKLIPNIRDKNLSSEISDQQIESEVKTLLSKNSFWSNGNGKTFESHSNLISAFLDPGTASLIKSLAGSFRFSSDESLSDDIVFPEKVIGDTITEEDL